MDFWRTVAVLFRRFYITVPAGVATLVLAGAAYSSVPLEYQSNAVLVLTTPLSGGTESPHNKYPSLTNPMMNFDRSLALTASIVIQEMNSAEIAQRLDLPPGGTSSYAVTNGSSNPELLETGPFIFVGGEAASPEAAQQITQRVSDMVVTVLAERQDAVNAPPSTHIGIQTVVPASTGQPLLGSPLRAAAAACALGGLASLAAVFGFENLMTHWRRRREARAQKKAALVPGDPVPAASRDGAGEPAQAAAGGRTRRARQVQQTRTTDRRVNGTAAKPAPAGAVDLLEGHEAEER
jgi:hypothetical protein